MGGPSPLQRIYHDGRKNCLSEVIPFPVQKMAGNYGFVIIYLHLLIKDNSVEKEIKKANGRVAFSLKCSFFTLKMLMSSFALRQKKNTVI